MTDEDDRALLVRMGLVPVDPADAADDATFVPLTGGVSSDIRLVRIGGRTVVLKRALAQLKVDAEWSAPIERGEAEARWLRYAATVVPDAVPKVLATDDASYAIALEYLAPEQYPNWKTQLLAGDVDAGTAAAVGRMLGRIHSASAAASDLAADFANDDLFESLRIEPYLRRTADAVPEATDAIEEVIALLQSNRRALVHGDVSPKNILIGAASPVLLDAECATWGDPAFDVAFCLNHLVLKAVHLPELAAQFEFAADALRAAYLEQVDWEPGSDIDARIDRILPALQLARVAGASPVEYLDRRARATVRQRALAALCPPTTV
ncbi:aminoglycoside phosphotransferase family protein [Microbacterium sp. H1-D42]|uniref:phosphotransferase family protein n=1 Tax=Microbacterium sp. H1-D42 TaxID=2925844 RepID=UPI001F5386C4|nr:aminoglycoside phosphotransferase family protein [Microbacterium sp. H1-D42]UNK70443.1 aminoglycoside phosphotransferase family protein [Microbacterium sp. H1-D42]